MLLGGAAAAASLGMPSIVRAAEEILVACVIPLTGPSAQFGQMSWNRLQLAAELMNAAGGVKSMGGAKITVAVLDTETKPEIAVTQVEAAIQRGAAAIIGCNQSAATIVASQVCGAQRSAVSDGLRHRSDHHRARFQIRLSHYSADWKLLNRFLTTAKELLRKSRQYRQTSRNTERKFGHGPRGEQGSDGGGAEGRPRNCRYRNLRRRLDAKLCAVHHQNEGRTTSTFWSGTTASATASRSTAPPRSWLTIRRSWAACSARPTHASISKRWARMPTTYSVPIASRQC